MAYYHDLVTQKSWEELKVLKDRVDFVLLGGWAVYLYTKQLKSKDIDIIVNFEQLSALGKYYDLYKNERLHKYEAVKGEVQIDVYLPHFSQLGIPVEDLIDQRKVKDGFKVLDINYLFTLKIYTLAQRGYSAKGQKDFLDLLSLTLYGQPALADVTNLVKKYHLTKQLLLFKNFLNNYTAIPELVLNVYKYSKLRKTITNAL